MMMMMIIIIIIIIIIIYSGEQIKTRMTGRAIGRYGG